MRPTRAGSIIPLIRNLGIFFLAILAVVFALIAGQYPSADDPLIPAFSSKFYYEKGRELLNEAAARVQTEALKSILNTELPVLALAEKSDGQPGPGGGTPILKAGLNLLAGVKLEDPITYIKAEIPVLEAIPVTADEFDEADIDQITEPPNPQEPDSTEPPPTVPNNLQSQVPLVAVYSTHTGETYELTDGLERAAAGKAGGVTKAAEEIKKVLEEQYGIGVVYDPTVHDTSFNQSYAESEKTIRRLLAENPGLQLVFDIHRDGSMTREQSVVKINGENAAKILIVVGSDARAEHPRWQENLKLARNIATKLDSFYPGLSRGISIKDGRYNQQYSTGALLIEIGSTQNTVEEAETASRLFANAVVAVLNEMVQQPPMEEEGN